MPTGVNVRALRASQLQGLHEDWPEGEPVLMSAARTRRRRTEPLLRAYHPGGNDYSYI